MSENFQSIKTRNSTEVQNSGTNDGSEHCESLSFDPLQDPKSKKARVIQVGRPQLMHMLTRMGQSRKFRWDKGQVILVRPELNLKFYVINVYVLE